MQSQPTGLGVDTAGVTDAVGESVKDFRPGDEVFTFCGMSNRTGSFQEIITMPSHLAAKKGTSLTFEAAGYRYHRPRHFRLPMKEISEKDRHQLIKDVGSVTSRPPHPPSTTACTFVPLPHLDPIYEQPAPALEDLSWFYLGGSSAVGARSSYPAPFAGGPVLGQ